MKFMWLAVVGCVSLVVFGCGRARLAPPIAKTVPQELEAHGDVRVDDYYWLRNREDPEVIAYLEAENAFTDEVMAGSAELRQSLFGEIKGRIKQNDDTVPVPYHGSFYYTRYVDGQEYPIHCRKVGSLESDEEAILDVNQIAEGHDFCSVNSEQISPGGAIFAYPVDLTGRRKYTIRFKDLDTGLDLPDVLENVTSNLVWANDDRTVFYVKQDPETLRWFRVYRHVLGTGPGDDELVFEEEDATFRDHFVVSERREGLRRLRILPNDGSEPYEIAFDDPAHVVWVDENREFDSPILRFGYESLNVPESLYAFHTETWERTLLKQKEVLGGFDQEDYVVKRIWAPADDGVEVPISLVHRRDIPIDGSHPLLLYGYGSYGSSIDPWFKSEVVSLLDRGFVYAIAHVRGGQELGRSWYEGGKLLNKKNTFTDFIDCAEFLIDKGYSSRGRVFARGGSAGGLLMGAMANMAPELFAGIIAEVPFVDVVTTMLDTSIPLTTSEFDEWGDPRQMEYFAYLLSYSPYDNLKPTVYPHMLVTTGLHDSQVQYWEPAKWVAKLRATATGDRMLLLRTDMESGHGGPSGRYEQYEETALVYAFMLKSLEG